jgi:hypothetical protein
MEFINLTPHAISIIFSSPEGELTHTVPPSSMVARVSMREEDAGLLLVGDASVPVITRHAGRVEGVPAPELGKYYLVSSMVLDAMHQHDDIRGDVYAPDTGPTAVRNDKGHIIAVRRLVGLV